jgi:hypothetical protein
LSEASEVSGSDSAEDDKPVRLALQDEAVVVQNQPAEPVPKRLEIRVTDPCTPMTSQDTFVPLESEYCYSNSLAAI